MACTICDHPQRNAIDSLASLGASSERRIAKQFGVTGSALHRHKAHIAQRTAKAVEKAEAKQDDEFLDSIRSAMAQGAQGATAGLARVGEIDAATAYRSVPAFLAQQLRAAELLGNATGRLNQPQGAAGATNVYLAVVLPRGDQLEQPAIEVQALPAADPDTTKD